MYTRDVILKLQGHCDDSDAKILFLCLMCDTGCIISVATE